MWAGNPGNQRRYRMAKSGLIYLQEVEECLHCLDLQFHRLTNCEI